MKILVGKIKGDCSEKYKDLKGMTIAGTQLYEDDSELCALQPLTLDDMEKFYKSSYEDLKNDISSDYDYCIWYLLNGECEFVCSIPLDELEDIREYTTEDDKEYGKNIKEFKLIHNFYGVEKKLKDEEKAEKQANRRFEKKDKIKILAKTREGYKRVSAVIYKGFAIHNPVGCKYCGSLNTSKAITALDGEFKGESMGTYPVDKCKGIIDKVRKAIGDRPVETRDEEKVAEIVKKY